MPADLFHAALEGDQEALQGLLQSNVETLHGQAARALAAHTPHIDLQRLVDQTLQQAEADFSTFAGSAPDEWQQWLTAILQKKIDEALEEARNRFQVAMATLPVVQGQIVRLRHVSGWQLARIAEHLGLHETVVAGLLRQGVRRLRSVLEDGGGEAS